MYRGEWQNSKMHGCGVKLIPRSKGDIVPQEGEWLEDGYLGDIMACSKFTSRKKAMDADFAAASARAFEVREKVRKRESEREMHLHTVHL